MAEYRNPEEAGECIGRYPWEYNHDPAALWAAESHSSGGVCQHTKRPKKAGPECPVMRGALQNPP